MPVGMTTTAMQAVRYADLLFQPDMLAFQRDDGTLVRLTRQERALLLRLCRQPHKLVTRAQLLQSMSDLGGEFGERNIDYLVNRLRKRLGDTARAPRFIATQYGEGYIWLADPVAAAPLSCFMLIGPVYGLDAGSPPLTGILERLRMRIEQTLGAEQRVSCQPQWRFAAGSTDRLQYNLEISLLQEDENVHMALILRDGKTQSAIKPFRIMLPTGPDAFALEALSNDVTQAIWAHSALPSVDIPKPTDNPPYLRLHDAGLLFSTSNTGWRENAPRLERAYADFPDDPAITVMLASNRYLQLVSGESTQGGPLTDGQWQAAEDDIERLALQALPKAQDDAMLSFCIAKILIFLDRGYLPLAQRLVDAAFQHSTAFATAFAMKGQVQAAHGDIDQAIRLYDKAIELAEPDSEFHIYLLIMKIAALMAEQRRSAIDLLTTELYALAPRMRILVSLFFLSPKARQLPPALRPLLDAMSIDDGRRLLMYLYRVSARQFGQKRHQKNILRGAAVHLGDRFGPQVVPEALARKYPGLAGRGK